MDTVIEKSASSRQKNQIKTKRLWREIIFFAVIAGIPLLQFCVFYIGVNVNSIMLAFKSYDAYSGQYTFVGLTNFSRLFIALILFAFVIITLQIIDGINRIGNSLSGHSFHQTNDYFLINHTDIAGK